MKAGYVLNVERNPRVHPKVRDGLRSRWHTGSAHLFPDNDPDERQHWLATHLPSTAANARAVRLFRTQLLSVRIDLDGWFVSRGVKIVRTAFLKIAEYKNSRSATERRKALIPKSNPTMCHRCKRTKEGKTTVDNHHDSRKANTPRRHFDKRVVRATGAPVDGIVGNESTVRSRRLWCKNRQCAHFFLLHAKIQGGGMIHHPNLGNDFSDQPLSE